MLVLISLSSEASIKAKKLGLKHVGAGRYADKKGFITHKTLEGKLRKLRTPIPPKKKVSKKKAEVSAPVMMMGKKAEEAPVMMMGKKAEKVTEQATTDLTTSAFGPVSSDSQHLKQFKNWAKKSKIGKNFNKDERYNLSMYKEFESSEVNETLRDDPEDLNENDGDNRIAHMVNHIDSAMKKSKLPEDIEVFRGMQLPKKLTKGDLSKLTGKIIKNPAYSSTTTNPNIAKKFASKDGVVVKMTLPKGFNAIPVSTDTVKNLDPMFEEESEILCPRNMGMKIVKVEKVPKDKQPPAHIIHAIPSVD